LPSAECKRAVFATQCAALAHSSKGLLSDVRCHRAPPQCGLLRSQSLCPSVQRSVAASSPTQPAWVLDDRIWALPSAHSRSHPSTSTPSNRRRDLRDRRKPPVLHRRRDRLSDLSNIERSQSTVCFESGVRRPMRLCGARQIMDSMGGSGHADSAGRVQWPVRICTRALSKR
jgi:hypothetical protein